MDARGGLFQPSFNFPRYHRCLASLAIITAGPYLAVRENERSEGNRVFETTREDAN